MGETVVVVPISYRPAAAAAATGFPKTRIYELIASGAIKAKKDGRCTLIERAELERYIASLPDREAS